ncbi:MAG: porin [Candidatus Hinthialibacter antarcticus]|nr:porin [Candidatus Hinthialibacter antarcticus]
MYYRATKAYCGLIALSVLLLCSTADGMDQNRDSLKQKVVELENQVRFLTEKLEQISPSLSVTPSVKNPEKDQLASVMERLDVLEDTDEHDVEDWYDQFTFGGYGEMHANFSEGGPDVFDIHRLVFYLGYEFSDWIQLHSETEIEHAYVSSGSGGEVAIEQLYFDFLLSDYVNIRAGRILSPMGIINRKHEPPSFYGVERPSFAKYILPTTWSSDGLGIFGSIATPLKYEAYVVNGLDGSKFSATNGIRGGRIKERSSFNDVAFTGRLDYYPFAEADVGYKQSLRLGASTYIGGTDNGNNGNDPGIDGDIQVYSADFEYSILDFDIRGVMAFENIDGAFEIGNGTASEIFGWYLEVGYHFMLDSWKEGMLKNSDAVGFVRFDDFDTQNDMPFGVAENPKGDRQEWTFGVNFYPTPSLVLKADYQIRDDASTSNLDNLFNLGIGWQF